MTDTEQTVDISPGEVADMIEHLESLPDRDLTDIQSAEMIQALSARVRELETALSDERSDRLRIINNMELEAVRLEGGRDAAVTTAKRGAEYAAGVIRGLKATIGLDVHSAALERWLCEVAALTPEAKP